MAENHHPALNRPLAALLLALILIGFYWKLVLTDQFTWFESSDLAHLYIPRFEFMASELHHGRIPLWDPNLYLGQPLLAQSQPGVAYPLNWLMLAMPLHHGWIRQVVLHWYFVVIHMMAAWAAYRLARDLGCRRSVSIFSGCVYALAGYMAPIQWPDVLHGAVWIPLVLMHVLRALRGGNPVRAGIFGGFFLGLAWLGGHHQTPLYMSMACAGLWLAVLVGQAIGLPKLRVLAGAILFYAVAFGTAAVQILPTLEYARRSVRWVSLPAPVVWGQKVPFEAHQMFPFRPADLLGILFPGFWTHDDPFLGACALTFIVLGVALCWRLRTTKALVFLALGGLFYSMAGYSVFHGLIYSLLPLADKARNASYAMILFHLPVAALAGLGLEHWLQNDDATWPRRLRRAALIFAGLVFAGYAALAVVRGFSTIPDDRPLAVALAALLVAGLLWDRLQPATAAALVTAIFLFEAGLNNTFYWRSLSSKQPDSFAEYHATADIAQFLLRQPGHPRVDVDDNLIPFNFGDMYGIPQKTGFLAGLTTNVYREALHLGPEQNLFGVAYSLRKDPTPVFRELAFTSASGLKLYRNPDAFPRAWASSDDRVDITSYLANEVHIHARMQHKGMVILSDTFYPGWRADVDGHSAEIHEVYGAARGVVVDAGDHQLTFRFRPASVYAGAALSLLTVLLVAWRAMRPRSQS